MTLVQSVATAGDFYVPAFELRLRGRPVAADVVRDVISVTYKDDVAEIDSFEVVINNWDADLRCFDLSLDPSDRKYGSLWGTDPFASNYGAVGFARVCTPESWLSTWSGLSSQASFRRCAPAVKVPTLLVAFTGDAFGVNSPNWPEQSWQEQLWVDEDYSYQST